MHNFERNLGKITMAPYIVKGMALIGVKRKGGSNMFRHQISTLGILLDYKYDDPILLKAACIHDLFEDAPGMPGVTEHEITSLDGDGRAVYDLVMEVTIRGEGSTRESKAAYLARVLQHGSHRAKVLKLADRISNLTALGFVHESAFVKRFVRETKTHVLPHAKTINADLHRELSHLIESREHFLTIAWPASDAARVP